MLQIEHPPNTAAAWQRGLALQAAGQPATWVAGATALQLAWGGAPPAGVLIDVRHLAEAQGVSVLAGGRLRIGAAMTLEALRRDALVQLHASLLGQACAAVGAMGLRHLATLGGNIGWRWGDALVALLALQADAELADGRCLPLADLLAATPPGEGLPLLLAVRLQLCRAPALQVFEKLGPRAAFSPSLATLALRADQDGLGRLTGLQAAAGATGLPARMLVHTTVHLLGRPPALPHAAARQQALHRDLQQALLQDLPDAPAAPPGPAPLLRRVLARWLPGQLTTLFPPPGRRP